MTEIEILPAEADQPVSDVTPYSDGRQWDEALVLREIGHHLEMHTLHAYELGRRLVWARHHLGHGRFSAWCAEHFPFITDRTVRRYMRVAALLVRHAGLRRPAANLSMQKLLLLASIPEDQLGEICDEGRLAEVPLDQLGEVPYAELRKQLARTQERSSVLEADLERERAARSRAQQALGEAQARLMVPDQTEEGERELTAVSQLEEAWVKMQGALEDWHTMARRFGRAHTQMSPQGRARVEAILAASVIHVENAQLAYREGAHGDVAPQAARLLAEDAARTGFPIPARRHLTVLPG